MIPDQVAVALTELGRKVREDSGSNNDKANRIRLYNDTAGWKGRHGIPYCATFTSYCFIIAGVPIGGLNGTTLYRPGTASCYAMAEWFKNDPDRVGARMLSEDEAPEPGDAIFIDTAQAGVFNHAGIVERCAFSRVYTIEGNTSDAGLDPIPDGVEAGETKTNDPTDGGVHRRLRHRGAKSIAGFGRVSKSASSGVVPPQTPHDLPLTPFTVATAVTADDIVAIVVQMRRDQIKAIQSLLSALGAYEPGEDSRADGVPGKDTRKAIKRAADHILAYVAERTRQ
jgi:hypothetical protein